MPTGIRTSVEAGITSRGTFRRRRGAEHRMRVKADCLQDIRGNRIREVARDEHSRRLENERGPGPKLRLDRGRQAARDISLGKRPDLIHRHIRIQLPYPVRTKAGEWIGSALRGIRARRLAELRNERRKGTLRDRPRHAGAASALSVMPERPSPSKS